MKRETEKPEFSTLDLVKQFIKDPERKSIFKVMRECIYLAVMRKTIPWYYFSRYLFKKGRTNISDYSSSDYLYNVKKFFNDYEISDVLENKLFYNFYYSQFNVPLPEILMYNHRKMFVIGNRVINVGNVGDFKILLEELLRINPQCESFIVKRTYGTFGGDRVFKIYAEQVNSSQEDINKLYEEVIKAGYLFQKTIKQHPDLNLLNPSSVNTLRLDTFIDSEGKAEIISGLLRMSMTNLHVDNTSSGGCFAGIDLRTGKLKKEAYGTLKIIGVTPLREHPVTKTVFENFTIPLFTEAKELVIKTASLMPALRLVGWDVTISESGPVMIEGNSFYEASGADLLSGGYRANPVFRKLLREINHI